MLSASAIAQAYGKWQYLMSPIARDQSARMSSFITDRAVAATRGVLLFMKTCAPPKNSSFKMKKGTGPLALLLAILAVPLLSARGQNPAASPSESPSEPEAMPILKKMSEYLAQTERFSVSVREGYDVVQESGQKIEFGEVRKVTVSRPDHLRIEFEKSDGEKGLVLFDGKEITVYQANQNIYASTSKPGTLDDAIKFAVGNLKIRFPLAMMLLSTFPSELESRVDSADYVEKTTVTDVPCDHLAARTAQDVDFQVWVAQGDTAGTQAYRDHLHGRNRAAPILG